MERGKATKVPKPEAERWIEVSGKLLEAKDLLGSQRFAKRAQETDPNIDGAEQILTIVDVLLAGEKRINNHFDWYAILQLDHTKSSNYDLDIVKRQYRRLALLLHPDKSRYSFSDHAFKLVCDAWAFLSDLSKKSLYDNELKLYKKFDPIVLKSAAPKKPPSKPQPQESPVRRSAREKRKTVRADEGADEEVEEVEGQNGKVRNEGLPSQGVGASRLSSFWTVCPYCYHLYEYPRVYEECCLRCQNCRRGFHAAVVPTPPPAVGPGKDMYYCCWAFFPIGFTAQDNLGKGSSWTPFSSMFPVPPSQPGEAEKGNNTSSSSDSGEEADLVDDRGGKKGKTENVQKNTSTSFQVGTGGNNVEPQTTVRIKTTARKSIPPRNIQPNSQTVVAPQSTVKIKTTARKSVLPRPNNRTVATPQNKANVGRSDSQWLGMDLNLEVQAEVEEPKRASVVEGVEIGSIDAEATEGIGFFEGLDDILGNLPLLSVPGAQKEENVEQGKKCRVDNSDWLHLVLLCRKKRSDSLVAQSRCSIMLEFFILRYVRFCSCQSSATLRDIKALMPMDIRACN
ncbi:hypothetical protein IFM89_038819 [Coptis chinensis]|uniref:J domain-containing protein n=1 Tax=Coptis chinensis TaxID=261450 RepID=A0A835LUL1_9MAGN|nr:hypothetical protein IFM89_038819 [Coptis chinensis]